MEAPCQRSVIERFGDDIHSYVTCIRDNISHGSFGAHIRLNPSLAASTVSIVAWRGYVCSPNESAPATLK